MCNVIHIRNKTGNANEVYIGRGSIWGNPYVIGRDGNREEVIQKYQELMDTRLTTNPEHWNKKIEELQGKTLVCFCKPQACHGDILLKLARTWDLDIDYPNYEQNRFEPNDQ